MERNWQRLPYPRFLENTLGSLWCGQLKLWDGKCIFSFRGAVRRQGDGRQEDYTAVATMSADLTGIIGRAHEAGLEFRVAVKIGGVAAMRAFDVVEVLPAYNPDSSFHHITLRLRERAGDGNESAVCA